MPPTAIIPREKTEPRKNADTSLIPAPESRELPQITTSEAIKIGAIPTGEATTQESITPLDNQNAHSQKHLPQREVNIPQAQATGSESEQKPPDPKGDTTNAGTNQDGGQIPLIKDAVPGTKAQRPIDSKNLSEQPDEPPEPTAPMNKPVPEAQPAAPEPPHSGSENTEHPVEQPAGPKGFSMPLDVVAGPPLAHIVDRPAPPQSDPGDSAAAAPAELASPEGYYYETTSDGDLYPLDPITGDRLHPRVIPESLLADDQLREGYEFIRDNANRMRPDLLLVTHVEADDLARAGIDLRAEAKELAQNNGILFLEGVTETTEAWLADNFGLNSLSRLNPAHTGMAQKIVREKLSTDEYKSRSTGFQSEAIQQIIGTGVRVVIPDYIKDSPRQADQTLHQWQTYYKSLSPHPQESLAEGMRTMDMRQGTELGFRIYRDWYLLGKMGSYLASHHATHPRTGPDDNIHSKLLVGANHIILGEGWESMGVSTGYKGENAQTRKSPYRAVEATRNGRFTFADRMHLIGLPPLEQI